MCSTLCFNASLVLYGGKMKSTGLTNDLIGVNLVFLNLIIHTLLAKSKYMIRDDTGKYVNLYV